MSGGTPAASFAALAACLKRLDRLGLVISGQSLGHRGRGDADGLIVDAGGIDRVT